MCAEQITIKYAVMKKMACFAIGKNEGVVVVNGSDSIDTMVCLIIAGKDYPVSKRKRAEA